MRCISMLIETHQVYLDVNLAAPVPVLNASEMIEDVCDAIMVSPVEIANDHFTFCRHFYIMTTATRKVKGGEQTPREFYE